MNFGLIGAAGFIAPKHMQAIRDTGHNLVAAVDPHDCVGRLDSYFPEAKFFTEIERFDRFLEKSRRGPEENRIQYVSVCTPNYLHDSHVRLALRIGADAICEKPLVISPWNLDALEDLESEYGRRVYNVLQLRLLEPLQQLKQQMVAHQTGAKADICLTYVTRRGCWYDVSWKGNKERSGGVAMNIGIHFFDMMLWLFGEANYSEVHLNTPRQMSGLLELEKARVRWFLSVDEEDLPASVRQAGKFAYRSMTLDGQEIEFSDGFTDLHTRVYRDIIEGRGFGIKEARPAIKLAYSINHCEVVTNPHMCHPFLSTKTQPTLPLRRKAA